jgi:phenylalanyl-tRNA synthetase alpha subunit
LRELVELRTRHTGKKSQLAAVKKLIGRVVPDERASFGQQVQQLEAEIITAIDEADATLNISSPPRASNVSALMSRCPDAA